MEIKRKPVKPVMRQHRDGYWICKYRGGEARAFEAENAYRLAKSFGDGKFKVIPTGVKI